MSKIKLGSKSSLYPYPATIISTEVDGVKNFMQLGFVGIVNANPGMVAMGVAKHHHTIKGMEKGGVFGLAIANEDMMLKADYVGIRPGDKVDKSQVFRTFKGDHGANLIEESPINLEIKIIEFLDLGGVDYTIIGEILEVYADEEVMTGKNPDIEKINPIMLSMYENRYFTVGEHIGNAWRDGLEYEHLHGFVTERIFPAFDRLEENQFFESFIDDKSRFSFDGNTYQGFQGFSQWLDGMRTVLKVDGLSHEVTSFDAKQLSFNRYEVTFTVHAKGTFKDGRTFEASPREKWILRKEDDFIFETYEVK